MARQTLVTVIDADTRKFRNGINKTKRFAKDLAANILKLGVIVAAAMTTAVFHTAKFGDEIDKASRRTGIAVDELQILQLATKLAGTEFSAIEKGLKTFNNNLFDFKKGTGEAKDAFNTLKLSFKDLENLTVSEQLETILLRANQLDKQFEKSAVLADLFGARTGTALLPLADSLEETLALSRKKIVLFSGEQVKQAADLVDNLTIIKAQFGGILRLLTVQAFPKINVGLKNMSNRIESFIKSADFQVMIEQVKIFANGVATAFSQFTGGDVSAAGIADSMKSINKSLSEMNANNTFGNLFETLKGISVVLGWITDQIKKMFKGFELAAFGLEIVKGEVSRGGFGEKAKEISGASVLGSLSPLGQTKNIALLIDRIATQLNEMRKEQKAPS